MRKDLHDKRLERAGFNIASLASASALSAQA